ncbi:MAG: tetratricopeptide repeat protein [Candidatus Thorarchaeota archaeon]
MIPRQLKILTRAEELFNTGKFNEAFELINNFENQEGIDFHEKLSSRLLRAELLFQQGKYKEVLKIAEEIYNQSSRLEENLLSVDALKWKALALIYINEFKKVGYVINQGEDLLKKLIQDESMEYKKRKANYAIVKGIFSWFKGDLKNALENFEYSLAIRENLGIDYEIAESLSLVTLMLCKFTGELDLAFKYAERSLELAKKSAKKYYIAFNLTILAGVYTYQGEIDLSIKNFEQSLAIYKELNHKRMIAVTLNNVGVKYGMKGDLERALECSEQSLAIHKELGNLRDIANTHDYLIQILIDKNSLKQAEHYLHDLEQLSNKLKNKEIELIYSFNKALLLKTSLRARNRVQAEDIFNQILKSKDLDYELTIRTLINLCELHLIELSMINDIEILNDIDPLIDKLLDIAKESHSYWVLSETYLLQAKLSLLTFNLKQAQQFLIKAQKIAEKYGIKRLAIEISHEHDELLKNLKMWENLKESEASLSERWKHININEQIENMVRNRIIDAPELLDEEPVLLLIVSEGGIPFFTQSFGDEKAFEDHLFGGFFTAINSFINEMFSEGLDRASFGKHTLLMNAVSPFLMCYVYKGQSYSAQKRIKAFINEIRSNKEVWNTFEKFYRTSRKIHLKDIPSLEPLITKIFREKVYQ